MNDNFRMKSVSILFLAFLTAVFPACSSGGSGGGAVVPPPGPTADVTVTVNEGTPFADQPLLVCSLNSMSAAGVASDGQTLIAYMFELANPDSHPGCGFLLPGASYADLAVSELQAEMSGEQGAILFKSLHPGQYVVYIYATADGTFTDYPRVEFTFSTQNNPAVLQFADEGADNRGYAADAPPSDPTGNVPGELVTITGFNLATTDRFFLEDGTGTRFPITELTATQLPDATVRIQGRLSPGAGNALDLRVENDTYPDDTIPTAQGLDDVYTYLPVITGLTNASGNPTGSCLGAEQIVIWGGGFLASHEGSNLEVTINGNTAAVNFAQSDDGMLVVTTPAFPGATPALTEPYDVPVIVTNADGNVSPASMLGYDAAFSYSPEIFSVTPAAAKAGDAVVIQGCGFADDAQVRIAQWGSPPVGVTTLVPVASPGDLDAPGEYFRSGLDRIDLIVPNGPYDAGQDRVLAAINPSADYPDAYATDTFSYQPVTASITPQGKSGISPDRITISGYGFDRDSVVKVANASGQTTLGASDNLRVVNANTIRFDVPCGVNDYGQDRAVEITDPDLPGYSDTTQQFDYLPATMGISPTYGKNGDGPVAIAGCGFDTDVQMTIGGAVVAPTVVSGNQLQFLIPCDGYGQLRTVSIVDPDLPANPDTGRSFSFLPVTTGISVSHGAFGDPPVTISGCGFDTDLRMSIGGALTPVTVTTPGTEAQFSIPCRATDFGLDKTISVDDPQAPGYSDTSLTFSFDPSCASMTPDSASCDDAPFQIDGCGFATDVEVDLAGHAATIQRPDANTLYVDIPNGANDVGTIAVTVTNPGNGASCSPGDFTFEPAIAGVTPNQGPAIGGTDVTVTGCGFQDGAVVDFGAANPGAATVVDGNHIDVTVPSGTGIVDVSVTNPDTNWDTLASAFTYLTRPFITYVGPPEGPEAGGTEVYIRGIQFHVGNVVARFGLDDALATLAASATEIYALTPPGVGTVNVVVENTDVSEESNPYNGFTYKDRNIPSGFTEASLSGTYNMVVFRHDFNHALDPADDTYLTLVGSESSLIGGGSVNFAGDGTYTVGAGGDKFEVTSDGVPSTTIVDDPGDSGVYVMNDNGVVTITPVGNIQGRMGALSPDGNTVIVAGTLEQIERASAIYVLTKAGSGADPVSLAGKTMGLLGFVHDYPPLGGNESASTFQGIVTFADDTTFTLSALSQSMNEDTGGTVTPTLSTGDDSRGTYSAATDGLFQMTFEAADNALEQDLFDSDLLTGIFTVGDGALPSNAQLFAAVNLSATVANPGRSMFIVMVLLGTGKDRTSFGGEDDDAGWLQAVFGHDFNATSGSSYVASEAAASYYPAAGQVFQLIESGTLTTIAELTSLAGQSNLYTFDVPFADGQFTVNGPSPAIEGFISEDDSVNASVEVSNSPLNRIRVELTR